MLFDFKLFSLGVNVYDILEKIGEMIVDERFNTQAMINGVNNASRDIRIEKIELRSNNLIVITYRNKLEGRVDEACFYFKDSKVSYANPQIKYLSVISPSLGRYLGSLS